LHAEHLPLHFALESSSAVALVLRKEKRMERAEKNQSQLGRIREPVTASGPVLIFNLAEEVRRLQAEQPWQAEHTANTLVKYPDLRIVLIALKAGARLPEHSTAGRLSIQTLSGDVVVHAHEDVFDLSAGNVLTLDQDVAHDVEARIDSVLLLTIAWPR
jgi:quercetin dioxygenase-like cupin family protein